jgi:hypothetical protein
MHTYDGLLLMLPPLTVAGIKKSMAKMAEKNI